MRCRTLSAMLDEKKAPTGDAGALSQSNPRCDDLAEGNKLFYRQPGFPINSRVCCKTHRRISLSAEQEVWTVAGGSDKRLIPQAGDKLLDITFLRFV